MRNVTTWTSAVVSAAHAPFASLLQMRCGQVVVASGWRNTSDLCSFPNISSIVYRLVRFGDLKRKMDVCGELP